jgi:hypothetical protein
MNTTHKIDNGWLISYGMRRAAAAKAQAHDTLLLSARNAAHDTTPRPPSRLPFASDVTAPTGNGFYWTYDECVFEGGVMRYFIRNRAGMPLDTAVDEDEANDKVYRLNNAAPRDAGVQRFATGRKYAIKANGNG